MEFTENARKIAVVECPVRERLSG